MPRLVCECQQAPGFAQELHEACVRGMANMIEKNDLCPICVASGFGSALGNMLSKADHSPEQRLALVQEAIYSIFGGYNSMSPDVQLHIRSIEIDELTQAKN